MLQDKKYVYFREVFELYIKEISVGWWVDRVGELFDVLRGYRKINMTMNCILPITAIYCMVFQFINFILY